MKSICLFWLFAFGAHLQAETEIDLSKFAKLIRFSGLPLETTDYTERESKIRNIDFHKVLYMNAVGRRFIYPAVIYFAPKNSIDRDKYDKIRNLIRKADANQDSMIKKVGFAYLPELDDAVICMDQIKMSKLIPSTSIEGEAWITTNVGGLSITCSSEKLNLDYQIFLTGQAEADPEVMADYRKELQDPTADEFREIVRELVQLVRESPVVTAQATGDGTQSAKRIVAVPEDPGGAGDEKPRPPETLAADKRESKPEHPTSYLVHWPWPLGLVVILVIIIAVILAVVRKNQDR